MRVRVLPVLVFLLPALAACAGDSSIVFDPANRRMVETGVEIVLDRTTYAAGDDIAVTLVNGASRDYGYNLCSRGFEKLIGSDWSSMPPELRLCTATLYALPAGATRSGSVDLPADFGPGTYRVVQPMYETNPGATASVLVMSAPFTIE